MTQYDPYDDDGRRGRGPGYEGHDPRSGHDPRYADPRGGYADPQYEDSRYADRGYYDPGVEPDLRADPDYGYAAYEHRQPRQAPPRRRRAFGPVVAVGGMLLFFATVWFAYSQGSQSGDDGSAPLVQADNSPIKMRPDQPGGMEVPHQDKLVFERLAGAAVNPDGRPVERLLPPPETPLPRPEPPPMAADPVPGGYPDLPSLATGPSVPLTHTAPDPFELEPEPEPAPVARAPAPQPAPAAAPPIALTPPPAAAPAPAPARTAPPSQVAALPAAPPAPPAQAPASSSSGGVYRVQVASLTSEDQARTEFARLQRRHPDVLGGLSLSVVRADLGDKGIRYRVQAGPLDENRAKSICDSLKAQNVGCILVRP